MDSRAAATPIASFTPSDLEFAWDETSRGFRHGYDRDLHLFVLWEKARTHEDAIVDSIASSFRILADYEIHWTPDRVLNNFERLYGAAVGGGTGKHEDAGTGAFVLLICEDPNPLYRHRQNVSGYIELTNTVTSEVKRAARARAGGYSVHSSNNVREFFRDATLLLGPATLDSILARPRTDARPEREILHADLAGAQGWADLDEVTEVLRRSAEYVVLRNFEDLPASLLDDAELDVLARDQLDLAAIVNGRAVDPNAGAGFVTRIGERDVVFDIRWVGDGYLDARWEDRILADHVWTADGIAVPRFDDLFFSLLYHAKVQKAEVKPAYRPRLAELATQLDLPDSLASTVTDDEGALAVLDGFLSGHGYRVPLTDDREVYRNDAFCARFELTKVEKEPLHALRAQLWHAARHSRIGERAANSGRLRAVVRRARALVGRSDKRDPL